MQFLYTFLQYLLVHIPTKKIFYENINKLIKSFKTQSFYIKPLLKIKLSVKTIETFQSAYAICDSKRKKKREEKNTRRINCKMNYTFIYLHNINCKTVCQIHK